MYAGRIVEQGTRPNCSPARRTRMPAISWPLRPDIEGERRDARPGWSRTLARASGPSAVRSPLRCEFADDRVPIEFPSGRPRSGLDHMVRCFHPYAVPAREQRDVGAQRSVARRHSALARDGRERRYTGHQVVHDVTLHVEQGECVALVGESGSGKTTMSRSIGGLHQRMDGGDAARRRAARAVGSAAQRRRSGCRIQYVFQNPYSSLNPRRTVGESVARPLLIGGASKAEAANARSTRCSSGCR